MAHVSPPKLKAFQRCPVFYVLRSSFAPCHHVDVKIYQLLKGIDNMVFRCNIFLNIEFDVQDVWESLNSPIHFNNLKNKVLFHPRTCCASISNGLAVWNVSWEIIAVGLELRHEKKIKMMENSTWYHATISLRLPFDLICFVVSCFMTNNCSGWSPSVRPSVASCGAKTWGRGIFSTT